MTSERTAPGGGRSAAGALDLGLARRLHRALTGGHEELFLALQDPSSEVLRSALRNPALAEDHLLALLRRRDLGEDLIKTISQLPRTEQSHPLKLALAKNPGTPAPVVLALLPALYLFELLDLCLLPGTTPDQRFAAERQIIQRLPGISLGNKLTLARRGTAALVAELLREGDPQLMAVCLDSPQLKEVALVQFVGGAKATAETISAIARHPKWNRRPNLRLAILKNPKTPAVWFSLFLPALPAQDLRGLLASTRSSPAHRELVEAELRRRVR